MSWHLVQCRNDCSPPWKNLSFTVEGENNFKPCSGKWEPYSLKGKKISFASLSSISSGTWWNLTCLPVLFGLFSQNSGQSLSLIHSPTAILNACIKASAEKVICQTPLQCRSGIQTFSFLVFACVKGHAFPPPQNTNPSHLRGGRESRQPKGATPWCHQCCSPDTEVGNNRSPPTGAPFNRWQGWHTHPALPTASPPSPKHSWFFPRPFTQEVH